MSVIAPLRRSPTVVTNSMLPPRASRDSRKDLFASSTARSRAQRSLATGDTDNESGFTTVGLRKNVSSFVMVIVTPRGALAAKRDLPSPWAAGIAGEQEAAGNILSEEARFR